MHGRVVLQRRRFVAALIAVSAVALLATASASAGERIHFKNGHMLDVVSSRVDGAMVFFKLPDGSEVGVPQSLIAEVEGGRDVAPGRFAGTGENTRGGRGPSVNELFGVQRLMQQAEAAGEPMVLNVTQDALKRIKVDPSRPMTVGFAYNGSTDINDLAVVGQGPRVSLRDVATGATGPGAAAGAGVAQPRAAKATEPNPRSGPP